MSAAGLVKTDDHEQTHHQVELAVEKVVQWLTTGQTEADVREALGEMFPAAPPSIVMTKLGERLQAEGRPDCVAVRGWAFLALRELYRKMVEIGDFDGALKAVKEITTLAHKVK